MHLGVVAANWASCERFILLRNVAAPAASTDQVEPVLPEIHTDNRWLRHVLLLSNDRRAILQEERADHSITPHRRLTTRDSRCPPTDVLEVVSQERCQSVLTVRQLA
jgi:hypothetical protein